jgi:death-on-curing protein
MTADNPIKWITQAAVYAVHDQILLEHGGEAGVRDQTLLEAALYRPLNKYHFAQPKPDLFELAAAYCFAFVRGHVFVDGNKRTGYMLAVMFLIKNGAHHQPDLKDAFATIIKLAKGDLAEDALAQWFRVQAQEGQQ